MLLTITYNKTKKAFEARVDGKLIAYHEDYFELLTELACYHSLWDAIEKNNSNYENLTDLLDVS